MSEEGAVPADVPPHRYTAALAGVIEPRWQDYWEARGTFDAPNPTGDLADPTHPRAGAPKMYVHDMFPYPSGDGLHVGHPLGYIGTDVLHALQADERATTSCTRWASTRSVCRPSSTRSRPAPTRGSRSRPTSTATGRSCAGWAWLRQPAVGSRRPTRTTTAGRSGSSCRSSTPGTTRRPSRARPIDELVDEYEAGTGRRRTAGRGRRCPTWSVARSSTTTAWPTSRSAGQLVPGPGHGAGQRGGHRRRAQRARQLPGLQARAEAVDDADHGVRRPPGRRPGRARLAGAGQADAEELDRPLDRRARRLPGRAAQARSRSSPPVRTRCSARPTWCMAPEHPASTR